jgi:hypothetical protein
MLLAAVWPEYFRPCSKREAVYSFSMGTVIEIEEAISKLSRQELLAFRDWFSQFDAADRDQQFEEDVGAGRLDALADEAVVDSRRAAGETRSA